MNDVSPAPPPASAPAGEPAGIAARVAKGAGWILASRLSMRLLGFANTIIVARLLAPADFGLIAVGMTAVQLLQGLSDIGVSQAVVKFRDAGRDEIDTLFTLSVLRGLFIAALMLGAAPLAVSFYEDARMAHVFVGLALYPAIGGFINPRFFEFERAIDFSKEFIWEVTTKILSVVVTIGVAYAFRSYWAIVWGVLAGTATQVVLSYLMRPHFPRFTFRAAKKVLGFSGWLTGISFIVALSNKLDSFVLARAVGPVLTGKYYVGFQMAELPTSELAWPIARAFYPGLSAMQGDRERMRAAYLRGVEALAAVAMPAALGFAFVSKDLIHVLLGAKWDGSALVVAWLTPAIGFNTVLIATQYYAMALGLQRLVFFRGLIMLLFKAPVFTWAAFAYGFNGAILAAAVATLFSGALNLGIYARASGRSLFEPLIAARRSFLAAAAMSAFFFLVRPTLDLHLINSPYLRLALDIALGGAIHIGALWLLWIRDGRPGGVERTAIDLLARMRPRPAAR
ncbi:MAG: lipopolysaccharide biosynthesis protein [Parvularculaceae bacterium]|nr:lipopolysaccharide biosynthesis protein [Parvularculaceae bacterium]